MLTEEDILLIEAKLDELKKQGNYRYFNYLKRDASKAAKVQINGKEVINFCGNDYLGMSIHKNVILKMIETLQDVGAGSGGTRNIGGSSVHHLELEHLLASIHKKESALIFNSAYMANLTSLSVIGKLFDDAVILSDSDNHSSMINGIRSSGAKRIVFRHNDTSHLEEILKSLPSKTKKIIAFESIYSIMGTEAPIKEICNLAEKYNAITYLDEVHSVGLYGKNGYGVVEMHGIEDRIDIINGTFAKAYGIIGGYIAGKRAVIDSVRSFGHGFIFTTSLPPSVCAGVIESIKTVANFPEIRNLFFKNVLFLKENMRKNDISMFENNTHITPVIIGDANKAKMVSDSILSEGFYVQPINYPTVPCGMESLRITVSPLHQESDILKFIYLLKSFL